MSRHTEMEKDASARIQSAAARDPESDTAQSGFDIEGERPFVVSGPGAPEHLA